ncbi:MAG: YggT family protein [Turicibacter sp.]|nr:YggT family protein [Turicibacter sp.]
MEILINWAIFALRIYQWSILACIILRRFPEFQNNEFARIVSRIVDPFLEVFRKIIPPLGGFDLSVLVAIFALQLAISGLSLW